jgi:ParB-like chromosome segregation protein Spo0J
VTTATPQVDLVPIEKLMPHSDNPRQGDIGAIMESVALNGWWGAIIASRRADDTLVILAGEHRWRALHALQADGYTRPEGERIPYSALNRVPPVGMVPVMTLEGLTLDDERKVLLADNRANDLSSYDNAALAELLTELGENDNLAGTLYDGDALDQLLADLNTEFVAPDRETLVSEDAARQGGSETGSTRTIMVEMSAEDFDQAMEILRRACSHFGVERTSDAAMAIWFAWDE